MAALGRTCGGADHERIGAALRHVLRGRQAHQGCGIVAHVVEYGRKLKRGQGTDNDMDLVPLNQLLSLGLGAGRIAAGVCRNELHLAAGEHIGLLFQEYRNSLLHLDAPCASGPVLTVSRPILKGAVCASAVGALSVALMPPQRDLSTTVHHHCPVLHGFLSIRVVAEPNLANVIYAWDTAPSSRQGSLISTHTLLPNRV